MVDGQLKMILRLNCDTHVQTIKDLVRTNRCLTAKRTGISLGSCHDILTEKLDMHRVTVNFVSRLMTELLKEDRGLLVATNTVTACTQLIVTWELKGILTIRKHMDIREAIRDSVPPTACH